MYRARRNAPCITNIHAENGVTLHVHELNDVITEEYTITGMELYMEYVTSIPYTDVEYSMEYFTVIMEYSMGYSMGTMYVRTSLVASNNIEKLVKTTFVNRKTV